MGGLLKSARAGLLLVLLAWAAIGPALAGNEFDLGADVRAIDADGEPSYLNGGLGKLRFDPGHDGLQLGYLRAGWHPTLGQIVHVDVEAVAYGDHARNPIDLTEAYAEIRPFPTGPWRSRVKLGAFYAPISLENRLRGWRTPYTLSSSAINTWVGEELRTIGAEYNLDWLGIQQGLPLEVGFTAAAYGWNDPAGTIIATRGWTLDDRQTTLFGRVGVKPAGSSMETRMIYNISGRVGYYDGLSIRFRDRLELRALHYDNRADPGAYAPVLHNYGWRTVFDSLGLRWEPGEWTFISQRLHGVTYAGENAAEQYNEWNYDSAFGLVSWSRGAHRLSARYDRFKMHQTQSLYGFLGADDGHAWTAAYAYEFDAHWSVMLEELAIDSEMPARRSLNEPIAASERELQLAVRLEL
jgi:hypothetical protein